MNNQGGLTRRKNVQNTSESSSTRHSEEIDPRIEEEREIDHDSKVIENLRKIIQA